MKRGAVQKCPGIYNATEKNLGKSQLGDCVKAIPSNKPPPHQQMTLVGSLSISERDIQREIKGEKERQKEGKGRSEKGWILSIGRNLMFILR